MAELDQAARYALKIDPAASTDWLVPERDPDLAFARWCDTETIAFPGEPSRRCDTVAELRSRSGKQSPWALVLEVEARSRSAISARLLEYVGRLMRKLRHGPHRRDRYQFAAAVIFLTGRQRDLDLTMQLPGTNIGLIWSIRVKSLAEEQAAVTLEKIGRGELGRSILAWVPLMAGSDDATLVLEWVRLAREETSEQRRRDYAGLALVLAERAGCLPVWQKALEGWNMVQSKLIAGWKDEARREGLEQGRAEGQAEAQRTILLKWLRRRVPAEPSTELTQLIQAQTDPEVLSRWVEAALDDPTLEAFRAAIQPTPPSMPAEKLNGSAAG